MERPLFLVTAAKVGEHYPGASAGAAQAAGSATRVSSGQSVVRWFIPLAAMTFILGVFIALALKTQNVVRRDNLPSSTYTGLAEAYMFNKSTIIGLQQTIGHEHKEITSLTDNPHSRGNEIKVISDELDQARFLAGLTPVEGPGIVVVLKDSAKRPSAALPTAVYNQFAEAYTIHDLDIKTVINELAAGGAEAFAVNGQRVVATTAIRCVGPAIQVNGVPLTPPYNIRAIGDPTELLAVFGLPGGVADQMRNTDPAMISVTKSPQVVLPAYEGATQFRYCQPIKEQTTPKKGTSVPKHPA